MIKLNCVLDNDGWNSTEKLISACFTDFTYYHDLIYSWRDLRMDMDDRRRTIRCTWVAIVNWVDREIEGIKT